MSWDTLYFTGTPLVYTCQINIQMNIILTLVYLLIFAVIFWLLFKTVNYFEQI